MAKKNTPFGIFTEAIGLYFSNFPKFIKYMTFPVLGQIGGLLLVFLILYLYTQKAPLLIEKFPNLNDFATLFGLSVLITLPGLLLFIKSFWEYLVAYGAINSMYDNMQKSGKVYDFDAHTELIKRRTIPFVGLWLLFGIFQIIAICPLFWIICAVFAVYFVLVFQVFTFEPELSPIGCVKRSFSLIKGHFASTFMLIALSAVLTYVIIPQSVIKAFEMTGINLFLANLIMPIVSELPIPDLSLLGINSISESAIAMFTIQTFIAQILIQYTLPMRSIIWSMWYKELSKTSVKSSSKKRPSEVLMEKSHKKYGKKKLDRNIIKRASEKDD